MKWSEASAHLRSRATGHAQIHAIAVLATICIGRAKNLRLKAPANGDTRYQPNANGTAVTSTSPSCAWCWWDCSPMAAKAAKETKSPTTRPPRGPQWTPSSDVLLRTGLSSRSVDCTVHALSNPSSNCDNHSQMNNHGNWEQPQKQPAPGLVTQLTHSGTPSRGRSLSSNESHSNTQLHRRLHS